MSLSRICLSEFHRLAGRTPGALTPLKKLSKVHVSIQKALGATTKIFELLDTPTIKDKLDAVVLRIAMAQSTSTGSPSLTIPVPRPALVSLYIEPGKSYALVGASGAGKSTMFSLLFPLLRSPPRMHSHRWSRPPRDTQKSLRESIGIVSQDTFLFHESILDNIRYGRLDATDEEVYEAARQALPTISFLNSPRATRPSLATRAASSPAASSSASPLPGPCSRTLPYFFWTKPPARSIPNPKRKSKPPSNASQPAAPSSPSPIASRPFSRRTKSS